MFKTNETLLKVLLSQVENGKIQLPDFQRGWVWEDDRIRGLLASISRRFPIGVIMTLDSGGNINFKTRLVEGVGQGNHTNESIQDKPDSFLLDGQQRLTSLYQALVHPGPVETQDNRKKKIRRWYYVDMLKAMEQYIDREEAIISVPEDRTITRNFGREVVLDLSTPELEYQNHMMPTERLLNGMSWMFAYNLYWNGKGGHPNGDVAAFIAEFNQEILMTFGAYTLPIITLAKENPKEAVCTVFEKVNTGGVTLTVFELVTASFAADAGDDNFSLREDWGKRRDRLHSSFGVLQGIEGDQFLQVVSLLTTQERRKRAEIERSLPSRAPGIGCSRNDILNLSLTDYQRWADKVEAGFVEAGKFLNSQYTFTARDVPYNAQLVPLAALYVELNNELAPSNAKTRLERWYWSGIFGEVYGSAAESQFALDLPQVAAYVRGGPEPELVRQANFPPERLLSLRTRLSAAYKGLYALQMKSGAADWRTAKALSLATWHTDKIEIHHIFPVAWCKRQELPVPRSLYDSVINKTPIDNMTNKIIGGRAPSQYIPRLEGNCIDPETLNRVLEAHWIEPGLLRADKFAECFVKRGEEILLLIGQAMGKPVAGGREAFWNALNSAGIGEKSEQMGPQEPQDEFDDTEVEYDLVGNLTYGDDGEVAA